MRSFERNRCQTLANGFLGSIVAAGSHRHIVCARTEAWYMLGAISTHAGAGRLSSSRMNSATRRLWQGSIPVASVENFHPATCLRKLSSSMAGPVIASSPFTSPEVLKTTRLRTRPLTCAARAIGGNTREAVSVRPAISHQRDCAAPEQQKSAGAIGITSNGNLRSLKVLPRAAVFGVGGLGSVEVKFSG